MTNLGLREELMNWSGKRAVRMGTLSLFGACLFMVVWSCLFIPLVRAEANFQTSTVSGLTAAYHMVSADFNGDTIPDLAVTQWSQNQVTVLLGDGLGVFTAEPALGTGGGPNFIAVGDFDGSGSLDMAITNGLPPRNITLLFNLGAGESWSGGSLDLGNDADVSSVVAANLTMDSDNDLDLFVVKDSGMTSDFYEVWSGDGTGRFTEVASAGTGNRPLFAAAEDVNGDGLPDMIVANYSGSSLSVFLGNGDGTLAEAPGSPIASTSPRTVATGNLNGDAHADLVVINHDVRNATVLLGNGDGTFSSGGTIAFSDRPFAAAIADFDGDGSEDVAITRWEADSVNVYYGNGDGTFRPIPTVVTVGDNPLFIAVADFDKDGRTDIAVTNYNGGSVTILLNKTGVCMTLPEGMISWWNGDDNWDDIIGVNEGVMMNGATFASGKVDQAFSLDGTDDYVQVVSPEDLPLGNSARTIALWFRTPRDLTMSADSSLVQYGTPSGAQMFGLITSGNAPGKLYFYGHSSDLAGTTTIQPDIWYHGAVTYDGSILRLYVNGQLETHGPMTLNTVMDGNGLTVGYRPGVSYWDGLIDEVQIFNRALSGEEIAAIHAAGSAGVCGPPDTTPDQFSFDDHTDVAVNTLIESNAITVTGINAPTDISITGGEFSIDGGSYGSTPSTVDKDQTVRVRQVSSSSYSTTTNATLTIGGVSDTFSVTTMAMPQYTISFSSTGNGTIVCEPATVELGSSSTCTVTPDPGYMLVGLTDNGSKVMESVLNNTYTISSVAENHSVVSTFGRFVFTPLQGTLGTTIELSGPGFGAKKGKVYLESSGIRYPAKVTEWNPGGSSNVIKAMVTKVPPAGFYRVVTVSKEVGEIGSEDTFEVMIPEVGSVAVNPSSAVTLRF